MAATDTLADDARQRLIERITGCWRTQALHTAVQLDLPDRLAAGPQAAASLAEACGCHAGALERLLRALCTLEVCCERGDGAFELAAAGELLRRDPPEGQPGLRSLALWWGGPMWPLWGELSYSIRTGASVRARQTGRMQYGFMDGEPGVAEAFHEAMRAMTASIADDLAARPVWGNAHRLVDVGGGHGELAVAMAVAHRGLQATVLDRADAEPGACALFERKGLAGRAGFVAGDFFESVPAGADLYLLKSILHNWDDAACRRIVQRCAEAAPRGARLLVVERVRPERLQPTQHDDAVARTDLNMLAGLGGRERTLAEFKALLEPAGFALQGVARLRHEFCVMDWARA